ncbi:exodeoxyribonuclease I [candidate division KSB1 bacterium]|nr:exodeoxyribonuclease I [candidate division KSB1 bacterium]NIR72308.1 exodeoxyribonuclease I [candidate division KSB1 bacterium]NIS26700.1 exodeoxyribonuclease I [candidate division KSB1 bacterium]NIT70336.1 exodeoxyribonuclease I [candidate division KSB1 bacterium]NIU27315.1 exodeoxyribonuclease I [candidate division KSB1 bacterium]
MRTYLFYDIETTGLNRAFDQVVQFAAIRTDETFHEIERHEIIVKLRLDVIPSPGAITAHCIPISRTHAGKCEFDATRSIHALLNQPDTTSLGYNTLGFDDEFLRFAFYRNLLPPYTHQYANNCNRMDLLPMVAMYWLYKNDVLEWPKFDGKVSLKLEHLSEANQLTDGMAHDALVDVEATVELARRLIKEKDIWKYLANYFRKGYDIRRIGKLPRFSDKLSESFKFGLLIGSDFGSQQNYQVPVLAIGKSLPYRDQTLWLRLDLPTLQEATEQTIPEKTWMIRKKYGEPGMIIPPYERFLARIDPERTEILEQNKRWLESNTELLEKIATYYCEFAYPNVADIDADAMLYHLGFLVDHDKALCRRFHDVSLSEKVDMCEEFSSPVVHELAKRVIFRNYSLQMPDAFRGEFEAFKRKINPMSAEGALIDYKGGKRTTPMSALEEIAKLRKEGDLNQEQIDRLDELEAYIRANFPILEPGSQVSLQFDIP